MLSWVRFNSKGMQKFTEASESLEAINRELPRWIQRDILLSVETIKVHAQQLVKDEATHGTKHTGLRESVAAGVNITPYTGALGTGTAITTSMPKEDAAVIPAGFDPSLRAKGWRHPVFGNKRKWVEQKGDVSWFSKPVIEQTAVLKANISADMEAASKLIQKG